MIDSVNAVRYDIELLSNLGSSFCIETNPTQIPENLFEVKTEHLDFHVCESNMSNFVIVIRDNLRIETLSLEKKCQC